MLPDDPNTRPVSTAAAQRVVVVLGMHRSGTSAVAGCLARLGVDFGPRLMPATEDNPRGYYEHIDLVNIHDRLLLALGRSWDDVHPFPAGTWQEDAAAMRYQSETLGILNRDFPAAALWGLKDPRLCRLLPWWEPLWRATETEPVFLLVRRAPDEVANSLARREGFSRSKSYLLWLQHTLEAERHTRGRVRALIDFKAFVADWRGTLAAACAQLGHPWEMPSPAGSSSAGEFIDPALLRSASSMGREDEPPLWVKEADAAFCEGLVGREDAMRTGFGHVTGLLQAASPLFQSTAADANVDLQRQLEAARRQATWYEAEWQKARLRYETARQKLDAKSRKGI